MGQGSFVNQPAMARPANSGQPTARPISLRIDVPLFLVVLTTLVFGLLML